MKNTPEVLKQWVTRTLEDGRGITKWENDFLVSIEARLEQGKELSERQEEILEKIYAEKTP